MRLRHSRDTFLDRIRRKVGESRGEDSGRKTFWLAFLLLMGLSTAWTVATPLMGAPDEPAHVIKAAAVVRGELAGLEKPGVGTFRYVTIPAGIAYLDSVDCFAQHADVTPACVKPFTGNRDELVEARTSAGNYNPVYYAVAGLPSLFSSDPGVVYGMRLVSSLLSSFFLALTFAALSRMRQRKWSMVATAVSVTPMVLFLNGVVNPNSLEYATAAALLANLALLLERSLEPAAYPRLVPIIAASGCLLANTKGLSLLWLALIVVAACILGTGTQLKALSRNPWVWGGAATIGLSCVLALLWLLTHDSLASSPFEAAGSSPVTGFLIVLSRTLEYSTAYVGQFGWLEVPPSLGAVVLWLGLATALILSAIVRAKGGPRAATVFLVTALLLLPPLLQAQAIGTIGIVWQGRYILAVFIPLLIASGMALDRTNPRPFSRQMAAGLKGTAVLVALFHFWTFAQTLQRYVSGWDADRAWTDVFANPSWQPPGGTSLSLAFFAAMLVPALWLVWRGVTAEQARQHSPSNPLTQQSS